MFRAERTSFGYVSDSQQAAVRGATIRVINRATGVERKTTTNPDGLYSVPFVRPGFIKSSYRPLVSALRQAPI